jgi:hypothetical protein
MSLLCFISFCIHLVHSAFFYILLSDSLLDILTFEIRRWRRRSCGTSSGKLPIALGFSVERLYIGGEATSEVGQGHHTIRRRAPGEGRATLGCRSPLAPLRLSFGLRPLFGKNRSFVLRFVQFREYFLCSFSET